MVLVAVVGRVSDDKAAVTQVCNRRRILSVIGAVIDPEIRPGFYRCRQRITIGILGGEDLRPDIIA